MTMDGDTAGSDVAAAINGLSEEEKKDLAKVWQTALGVLISHIQANAVVTGTCSGVTGVGPPTGPYPIVTQPVQGTVA